MKNHNSNKTITGKTTSRRIRWDRVVLLLAVFCLAMSWAINAFADSNGEYSEEYSYVSVIVHSGDTMWDLLQEANPEYKGDMNEAVYNTCKLNSMDSAALYAGQTVLIPKLP